MKKSGWDFLFKLANIGGVTDKLHLLPSADLLRTVRATFTAYGSSHHLRLTFKSITYTAKWLHSHDSILHRI
jgi:hypothetical protein